MQAGIFLALDNIKIAALIGKDLIGLPKQIWTRNQGSALAFYQIFRMLLTSIENISRWIHLFSDFDFGDPKAIQEFDKLTRQYNKMKKTSVGTLKFNCKQIRVTYDKKIYPKLRSILPKDYSIEHVETVFGDLSYADNKMVDFVNDQILRKVDSYVHDQQIVLNNKRLSKETKLNQAEKEKINFFRNMGTLNLELEKLKTDLSELVLNFASLSKTEIKAKLN